MIGKMARDYADHDKGDSGRIRRERFVNHPEKGARLREGSQKEFS